MSLIHRALPPLLACLFVAPPASGQVGKNISLSPGLSVSLSFGQKVMFGLGIDFRVTGLATGRVDNCGGAQRVGLGPFVQATWLNFSAGRFAAGLHGGGEIKNPTYALDGEVGWTYHTRYDADHPGQHGIHLGALHSFAPAFMDISTRLAVPLSAGPAAPEGILGAGGRFPSPFGFPGRCFID